MIILRKFLTMSQILFARVINSICENKMKILICKPGKCYASHVFLVYKKAGKNSTTGPAGALWMDVKRFNRIV